MRRLQPHEISLLKELLQSGEPVEGNGELSPKNPLRFSDFIEIKDLNCLIEISTFQQKLLVYSADIEVDISEKIQQRLINALNLIRSLETEGYITSWYKASLSEDESIVGSLDVKEKNSSPFFLKDLALAAAVLKLQARHYHLHPSVASLFPGDEVDKKDKVPAKNPTPGYTWFMALAGAILLVLLSVVGHHLFILQAINEQQQTLNQSVSNKTSALQEQLMDIHNNTQLRFDSLETSMEQLSQYLQSHEVIISDNTTELGKLTLQQRILNKQLKGTLRKTDSLIRRINQSRLDSLGKD